MPRWKAPVVEADARKPRPPTLADEALSLPLPSPRSSSLGRLREELPGSIPDDDVPAQRSPLPPQPPAQTIGVPDLPPLSPPALSGAGAHASNVGGLLDEKLGSPDRCFVRRLQLREASTCSEDRFYGKETSSTSIGPSSTGTVSVGEIGGVGMTASATSAFVVAQEASLRVGEFFVDWFGDGRFDHLPTGCTNATMSEEGVQTRDGLNKEVIIAALMGATSSQAPSCASIWRRVRSAPFFVVLQTAVTLAMCTVLTTTTADPSPAVRSQLGLLVTGSACEDLRHEVWRWLSYQFLHLGVVHVALNVAVLLLTGIPLERIHGTLRLVFMFNVGVFGGTCFYFVSDIHRHVVGMSGGCYALQGMHLTDVVLNWSEMRYPRERLAFLVLIGVGTGLNAGIMSASDVAHSVHVGGWVAGILIGILAGGGTAARGRERILQAVVIFVGVMLAAVCVAWGLSWPPRVIWEEVRWCWARQARNASLFGDAAYHCVRCGDQQCMEQWSKQEVLLEVGVRECTEMAKR